MISFGGGHGRTSTVNNPDTVWQTQQPFLTSLFQNAQTLFGNQGFQQGDAAQGMVNNLFSGAGPWAQAGTNPAVQQLMQYGQQGNPHLQQQIQGYGQDLGDFYRQQLLPGIQGQAGLAGQQGGSRQSIAAGMAGDSIAKQFAQGATNLRSNAYGQGIQATGMAGDLAGQNIGQMGNLFNLGMSPWQAAWQPLMNFANLIGGPTVLGGGGTSHSKDVRANFGLGV